MGKVFKTLAILNLTGELAPEISKYFESRNVVVVDPLVSNVEHDWTHIISKDLHDFNLLSHTYDIIKKDRHIISLTGVRDIQNFTINNGNIILDDVWFKGPMGPFILDKYFQGHGGITLGDNYPTFKEQGAFNVTNPFNTGEYLDRMIQTAFDSGIEALTIKTYFDHLIMYVAGLKNKNKAGLPFEVTYGSFNDIFALQIHFFAKDLDLMDVTTSLSSTISKRPEEYFLNIAVQSSDFFDFSYMPEVKKVVVTGLWTQDERVKFENRGLMFTSLTAGRLLTSHQTGEVSSILVNAPDIKDNSEKINIRDQLPGNVVTTTIKPLKELEKASTQVKGKEGRKDEPLLVKGRAELTELVNVVKGKFDENKSTVRIPGNKIDVDQVAFVLASKVDEGAAEQNLVIRSLADKLSHSIKDGLISFAESINVPVDELSDEDLDSFQLNVLPDIIQNEIVNAIHADDKSHLVTGEETSDEPLLIKGAPELVKLVSVVKGNFAQEKDLVRVAGNKLDVDKAAYKIATTIDVSAKETHLKVRSLGDKLPSSIKAGLFDFAKSLGKDVQDLDDSNLDDFQLTKLPDIIREGILNQKVLGGTKVESDKDHEILNLEANLQTAFSENEVLKTQMKTLASEVRILKDARNKMTEMQMQAAAKASESVETIIPDQDDELRKHFQSKINEHKTLSDQEMVKLSDLLERERKFIADAKQEELKTKKLQIEALQKETYFGQEIEKSQRNIRAKDLIILKSKETFTKTVAKKDEEILDLKIKLDQVSRALSSSPSQGQNTMIRELERQNLNLIKQVDVYKAKVSSIATNMQKNDEGNAKDEVRKLQMLNNQMKNQMEIAKKEIQKMVDRSGQEAAQINLLKQDKAKLEQMIKKMVAESVKAPTVNNQQNDQELKRIQAQNQILENQIKDSSIKITALENKLIETLKAQKVSGGGDDSSKTKQNQLENSVKKLTQDLIESRNQLGEMKKDTNKLRQEKTALQNMIDKMKKEADKAKAALPKKGGAGGKAA